MPDTRSDMSMSILVDMTGAALEPGYAEAAARRAAGGPSGVRRSPGFLLVLLVLVGAVTGVATTQVRRQADQAGTVREQLVRDVRSQTTVTDRLAAEAARLRQEVAAVQAAVLGEDARGRELSTQVSRLELATGHVPVRGEALRVTLDDAPEPGTDGGAGRGGQLGDDRVYDRDLQAVVNALWAAGAEAMAINGQRLTAVTAIRSAGEAVLVDFRPLSPPYVVTAIGDVDRVQPAFVDSATARRFTTYTSLYGLGFEISRAGQVTLPAAPLPQLRSATVPTPTPSPVPSPGGTP